MDGRRIIGWSEWVGGDNHKRAAMVLVMARDT